MFNFLLYYALRVILGLCHKSALYVRESSILASNLSCLYSHQLLKHMDRCILCESKIILIFGLFYFTSIPFFYKAFSIGI
jgi:hypothetical protein